MKKSKFQPISTDPTVRYNSAFKIRTHLKSPSQPTLQQKPQLRGSISSFEEPQPTFLRSQTRRLSQGQILNFALKSQDVKDTDQFDDLISSQYDSELQKFKYKNKAPELLRREKIQSSIYDKKAQSKLKYSKSKINSKANPVQKGTMSIMLNAAKKDYGFNLQSFKKKIPPRSRFKMKWKTIQWLINNRKEAIRQIFVNYKLLLKYARSKKAGMKRDEFGELLSYVGLGADQSLTDKLFYIFDEDQSGTVDYKELIIGLKILNEDSIEDKLEISLLRPVRHGQQREHLAEGDLRGAEGEHRVVGGQAEAAEGDREAVRGVRRERRRGAGQAGAVQRGEGQHHAQTAARGEHPQPQADRPDHQERPRGALPLLGAPLRQLRQLQGRHPLPPSQQDHRGAQGDRESTYSQIHQHNKNKQTIKEEPLEVEDVQ